jgi:hypothetical protein
VKVALLLATAVVAGCSSKASRPSARPQPPKPSSQPASRSTTDPYRASLAYARCLRARGVPHPNPNRAGDFNLTPADERRLRAVPKRQREAATRACFHTIKGLDNRPLSRQGQKRALVVLRELRRCIQRHGYKIGAPIVRNMTLGRMMFGFERTGRPLPSSARQRFERDQHACERQVHLAKRISKVIADDRAGY